LVKVFGKQLLRWDHPVNIAGFADKVKFTVKTLMRRHGFFLVTA